MFSYSQQLIIIVLIIIIMNWWCSLWTWLHGNCAVYLHRRPRQAELDETERGPSHEFTQGDFVMETSALGSSRNCEGGNKVRWPVEGNVQLTCSRQSGRIPPALCAVHKAQKVTYLFMLQHLKQQTHSKHPCTCLW